MARYVFSDLHAQTNLWEQIKNYIKKDDELICLGDCVDRGPGGITILQEVLADPRITMLRGNHEDFIINNDDHMWYLNGGNGTKEAIEALTDVERQKLIKKLKSLPDLIEIDNIEGKHLVLCHAGTDPWRTRRDLELMGRKDPYVWDRRHIHGDWSSDPEFKDTYVIHGHTPVTAEPALIKWMDPRLPGDENYDPEYTPRISRYCRGHKICIDMGCFYTGRTCLFNIDTFEAIYFESEDICKKELN